MREVVWHFDLLGLRTLYGGTGSSALTEAMILLTLSGGVWRDAVVASLLLFRRTRRVACGLAGVLIVAGLSTAVLKHVVGRRRPPFAVSDVHALWGAATTPSFPSGHTAAAFAMATFLAAWGGQRMPRGFATVVGGLLLLWAAGVALSRVYLGVHFPSDTIAGAVLGAIVGAIGAILHRRADAAPRSNG